MSYKYSIHVPSVTFFFLLELFSVHVKIKGKTVRSLPEYPKGIVGKASL